MWGRLAAWRGGWLPPPSGANAASGRLTIGRTQRVPLPSCPTKAPAALRTHTLGFKPFCLVRAVFHFAGDQEGQLHRLFVVEAGVYLAFVGAGEVGFTRAAGAANTLGHILSGKFDVHAAELLFQLRVNIEGLFDLVVDILEPARLDAVGQSEERRVGKECRSRRSP